MKKMQPIDVRVQWQVPGTPRLRTTVVKTMASSHETAFRLASEYWRAHARNAPAEAELRAVKL